VIADAILQFAKAARTRISREKEIGVFFGYYLVSDSKLVSFGHLAYESVFASPDVDFIINPGTYNDRQIGGGSGPQLVHGTALRYGKRCLHEIDHRTHCVSTHPVVGHDAWKTQADDNAGHKREAAFSLINHMSLWWFDMWGGWYRTQETLDLIKQLQKVSDAYVNDRSPSVAEALLIADPQSACYLNEKAPHASAMARQFRDKLNKTGAPFDVYSFNDIPFIDLSRYKVIFLPAMLLINQERAEILKKYVLKDQRTIVWTYAPGISDGKTLDTSRVKQWTGTAYGTPGPAKVVMNGWNSVYSHEYRTMTSAVMKEIMANAGVHLYIDELTPVYANERLLALHFKTGGVKQVCLPHTCSKVVDVFSGKVVAENVSEFTYEFMTPDTALFEIVR
jgi:hypothetical protein